MSEAWKQLNLDGEGLQSISLKLAQQFKQRNKAYRLLGLFPLGLHRSYLDHPTGAYLYRTLSVAALAAVIWHAPWMALALLGVMLLGALYDIRWIDDRVAALNKAMRIQAYRSRPAANVPADFRGHYVDDALEDWINLKETERGGHVRPGMDPAFNSQTRAPSIAQQEAMLRAMAKAKPTPPDQSA